MTDAPDTVTEALQLLAADGYTDDVNVRGGSTVCPSCGGVHVLEHSHVERQFRFEGASNPDDEAIVLGLSCPACGTRGVLVSGFGPSADPDLLTRLVGLPWDRGASS